MKKIIIILVCILNIKVVVASTLDYVNTSYFVKINDSKTIRIKKIYNKETKEVVFNLDYKNYEVTKNFSKYEEINDINYGPYFKDIHKFNTIVFYGYNEDKSDLNYALTQIMIWRDICNYNVLMINSYGNESHLFDKNYNNIKDKVLNHNLDEYQDIYNKEIWDKTVLPNNILINNDYLKYEKINSDLIIYNDKIGNYEIELYKDYHEKNYSYKDGKNIYWQSLGGPGYLSKNILYNISGIKFNIKENIVGINNRVGDAKLYSEYELYLDNELKTKILNNEQIYIKSNSNYLLKDISNNKSFINSEDILFSSNDKNLEVVIDKYVISKNISINILDNKKYYVYLKSNNELYEEIDSSTNTITLPYGIYYIKDKDNTYYQEISVIDSMDELIEINNSDNNEILMDIIENPQTIDNFYTNIFMFFINLSFIIFVFYLKINKLN